MKIFFDGGCRPNPGEMEVAAFARGELYHRPNMGPGSSHEAEWLALLHAVQVARMLGETNVELLGDSMSVIAQVNGSSKPGREFLLYLARFREEARHFNRLRVRHIRRTQNLAGIALARIKTERLPVPAPSR
jgi:ribonuclease HI